MNKITKYFLIVSNSSVFNNNNTQFLNAYGTSTSTLNSAALNTNKSNINNTNTVGVINIAASNISNALSSSIGGIGGYIGSWPNTALFSDIVYIDFFNCNFKLIQTKDSSNEFKISHILNGDQKYPYIIDKINKRSITIADLNYYSFEQMFLDLTIKNLFEISEINI